MWKFGSLGLKLLKMLHLLMIVLFLGGILSSFALIMKLGLSNYDIDAPCVDSICPEAWPK